MFYNKKITGQMLVANLTLRCGCFGVRQDQAVARGVSWPCEDFWERRGRSFLYLEINETMSIKLAALVMLLSLNLRNVLGSETGFPSVISRCVL